MKIAQFLSPLICIVFAKNTAGYAQKLLFRQNGVSLSYSYEFVDILKCGDNSFDQYKVTAYLENDSGHTINISYSKVEHIAYRNQLDVAPCRHPFPSGATIDIKHNWPSGSTSNLSYYVLIPRGEKLPEPDWSLGQFSYVN